MRAAFSPLSLSPHLWLDPSDLTTLFQTNDTSTPVTADGQTVGLILDKSGNDLHLSQATEASRPLYKTSGGLHWLEFDGVDDLLSVTYSALAQPWERISAFRKLDDLPVGSNDVLLVGPSAIGQLYITPAGQIRIYSGTELGGLSAPDIDTDFVATERHNGASSRLAVDNGAYQTGNAGATSATGVSVGADPAGGGHLECRFYGLAQYARLLTDPEIALLLTYLAAKQGRVL